MPPGLALAHGGDAGPCPALDELAGGADLFIAGTTPDGTATDPPPAGARRLPFTHFWPGGDRTRAAFPGGEVLAAGEGMVRAL